MNTSNTFEISEKSYKALKDAFRKYPQVEEVVIFGSRAKGTAKKGSDIDLAIKGRECDESLALDIKAYFNHELPIPYMVDVINYSSLKQPDLKEHIDRVGIIFFSKNEEKVESKEEGSFDSSFASDYN